MKIDKIKSTKKGLVAEYKYKLTNTGIMSSLIREIQLTGKLAVPRVGNSDDGIFKAGNLEYIYKIDPIELEGRGTVWNISFGEKDPSDIKNMPTGNAKSNYIKILDTMYQVIKDFIKDKDPQYIGLSSMDKSGYYGIYSNLHKSNPLSGYMKVNDGIPFKNEDGETGKMMLFRKKQSV